MQPEVPSSGKEKITAAEKPKGTLKPGVTSLLALASAQVEYGVRPGKIAQKS